MQRTYALNDEAALVICDYGKAERPRIPFPYYAEAWTGLEYLAASHMIYAGMTAQGVECYRNVRAALRWREAQSLERARVRPSLRARHVGVERAAGDRAASAITAANMRSPSKRRPDTAASGAPRTAWGTFQVTAAGATIHVDHGTLECRTLPSTARTLTPNATLKEGEDLRV